MVEREEEIIEFALEAGKLLLENGAEIFRVEETIERICEHYHVNSMEAFVLTNGIFITAGSKKEKVFAKVKHIPVSATHLDIVTKINQLSREIELNDYSIDQSIEKLNEIKNARHYPKYIYILASGIGSGGFCYLFGGSIMDCMGALIAGILLYCLLLIIDQKFSKIVTNILGGMFVSLFCIFFYKIGIADHLNYMIIGSIMPLIPGVPFINSIREITMGDYLSGIVRMLDTLVVFFCIAIGVGIAINMMSYFVGGLLL